MQKIFLIIQREYLTRIRKRVFWITTFLLPLFYLLLIFGSAYILSLSKHKLNVALIDKTGYFTEEKLNLANLKNNESEITLINNETNFKLDSSKYDGLLILNNLRWDTTLKYSFAINTKKSFGSEVAIAVQEKINTIWDDIKNEKLGIEKTKQQILAHNHISIHTENISNNKVDDRTAGYIGRFFSFLMYFIILIYGSQVMMGVMEEKTNRIAEIIVSSVSSFQMMMGKILGIAFVALTQFAIWIATIVLLYQFTKATSMQNQGANQMLAGFSNALNGINIPLIIFCFIFYFLGGFFFYASIYGAIGSAINEDVREAQSLSFPVTMLVVISFVIMNSAQGDPTGKVAFWGSLIPFSSPLVMMARLPYGVPSTVPWWQLILSMFILISGFIFTTWFAAKIYRTGILLYGKKVTWKEMIKWAFVKN